MDTSKEYVSSFLLCISPLLSTLQKHIPALSEEVYWSVSVGQRCRYVSGVGTYRLAPTFLALVSLRMLLGIFLALLGIFFAMPILVGQENIYDMVYGGLVYAQVRSHILHKQVPVLCMILL